jgi:16S rRNA processing protein RimM
LTDLIVVGRINGLFGTRGWVKALSYTRPRDNLLNFDPWYLRAGDTWQTYELAGARRHGRSLIASLRGVDDRDSAATLLRRDIAVERAQLPAIDPGEYYWVDLIGLRVVNRNGADLGRVTGLLETGATDVLQVAGRTEYLIPFVNGVYIDAIDLTKAEITVDWHPDD